VVIPSSLLGQITCSMPNPHLHFFEGCLYRNDPGNNEDSELGKAKKLPANIKNLLLRGSRIKNLEWVVGVVVYTGQDTKIMKNADQGKNKLSNIDQKCNRYAKNIILQIYFLMLPTSNRTFFFSSFHLKIHNLCDDTLNAAMLVGSSVELENMQGNN